VPYPNLGKQALEVQVHQDDADRPRHGGRVGDDAVGGAGDVVATRGGEVAEGGDHRDVVLLLEANEVAVEQIARRDAAARTVDAEHDRLDAPVVVGPLQLRFDALDRA